jgi:succinate dehydrogenase/fumarate reductase flavoprotein subunit
MIETWETSAAAGESLTAAGIRTVTVKGDTVEEVIEQLGLPLEETLASVERYNGFCETGVDEDFGKRPGCLWALKTPPFYGSLSSKPNFLTVMGGLRTDVNCRVCDEDDNPIPGLYNVGSMMGDMFSPTYNFLLPGHSYGLCTTYGKIAGEFIAANE